MKNRLRLWERCGTRHGTVSNLRGYAHAEAPIVCQPRVSRRDPSGDLDRRHAVGNVRCNPRRVVRNEPRPGCGRELSQDKDARPLISDSLNRRRKASAEDHQGSIEPQGSGLGESWARM